MRPYIAQVCGFARVEAECKPQTYISNIVYSVHTTSSLIHLIGQSILHVSVSVPRGPHSKPSCKKNLVSLPEEPEHVQEYRSGHKKTIGTVTKTYLQCGCDHVEPVSAFAMRNAVAVIHFS